MMNEARSEELLVATRTHPKVLIGPVVLGVIALAVAVVAQVLIPVDSLLVWLGLGLWILCGVVLLAGVLAPVLRWRATTFTVTTQQIQTRTGLLRRSGSDIPLVRITGIALADIPDVQITRDLINDFSYRASGSA